jgi:hypothetical protein
MYMQQEEYVVHIFAKRVVKDLVVIHFFKKFVLIQH